MIEKQWSGHEDAARNLRLREAHAERTIRRNAKWRRYMGAKLS